MNETYKRKYVNMKALDVDTTKRRVKIAIAEMETKDYDGDIILPTAANRTIKERGPKGSNEIWHLLDHNKTSFSALSKPDEIYVEGKYLVMVSPYRDSFAWREVAWPLYKSGDFTQHSIGYTVVKEQQLKDYNEIQELMLWEGSAVLWGANKNTPTLSVEGKSLIEQTEDMHSRFNRLIKAVNTRYYGDDNSLLVLELRQMQRQYDDLNKSIHTVEKTNDPDKDHGLSAKAREQLTVIASFIKQTRQEMNI
jgi:phage head maturation protease